MYKVNDIDASQYSDEQFKDLILSFLSDKQIQELAKRKLQPGQSVKVVRT